MICNSLSFRRPGVKPLRLISHRENHDLLQDVLLKAPPESCGVKRSGPLVYLDVLLEDSINGYLEVQDT